MNNKNGVSRINEAFSFVPVGYILMASCIPAEAQNEQSKAETAMRVFLNALANQDYSTAAKVYGGDYEELVQWNPDVAHTDYEALWQRGCKQNGLMCLKLKDIVKVEQSNSLFIFTVTFETADGKVFETSGCCGEIQKSNSEFLISVRTDNFGAYKVISGLPYVP